MLSSNNNKSLKLKSRWLNLNRSEQDLPDLSIIKSPSADPVGATTPIASGNNAADQMNDVSSSSSLMEQEKQTNEQNCAEVETVLMMPVFEKIEDNIYSTNEKNKTKSKDSKRMLCECTLPENGDENEISCGSDCLNRLLYIECGPRCRCGDRCTNRRFQKHEYAPVEPFPAGAKGWGLRATAHIPKNTFVMEYVGEVLNAKRFRQRIKQYAKDPNHKHHYFMALKNEEVIDATQKGSYSRLINHSCQPNCETQKWTVDGRLRIGFFTIHDIEAGEELTFDYKFQRYGREAQKCYCGTPACRGFIGGEAPSEAISQRQETTNREVIKKKKEKLPPTLPFGDMLFDQELADLLSAGTLKNRDQVVTYCRLMVRAEDISVRMRLLDLLTNTSESCLRLFIDHHGCQLLWVWMADDQGSCADWTSFQLAVLKILKRLPIPHRNMVEDSRLLAIVQRWAKDPVSRLAKRKQSSDDEEVIKTLLNDLINQIAADETPGSSVASSSLNDDVSDGQQLRINQDLEIKQLAEDILAQWSNLKENFRIPKKNSTVDGRKVIKEEKESPSKRGRSGSGKYHKRHDSPIKRGRSRSPSPKRHYKRHRTRSRSRSRSRSVRARSRSRSRSRSRDGTNHRTHYPRRSRSRSRTHRYDHHHYHDTSKRKHESKHTPERLSSVVVAAPNKEDYNKKTKEERRREFEAFVLKQEEEKKRLDSQLQAVSYGVVGPEGAYWSASSVAQTEVPMVGAPNILPPPPPPAVNVEMTSAAMAMLVYDTNTSRHWWQEQVTKVLVYPADERQVAAFAAGDVSSVPHFYHDPATGLIHEVLRAQSAINVSGGADDLDEVDMACDDDQIPREEKIAILKQEIADLEKQLNEKQSELQWLLEHDDDSSLEKSVGPLPPGWKAAQDKEGMFYYYHIATKRTQWDPPTFEEPKPKPLEKTPSPTKKSDRHIQSVHKSRSQHLKRKTKQDVIKRPSKISEPKRPIKTTPHKKEATAKKADKPKVEPKVEATVEIPVNLVVVEASVEAEPKANDTSTPLSITPDMVPVPSTSSDTAVTEPILGQTPHGTTMAAADTSSEVARKLKESFKSQLSNHVVKYLSAYRKPECKVGKITNNEDFKHLARKLTHAVMEKELKHCHRVEDLRVTESVLHKAKDYVKKYMGKIGPEYKRTNASP